MARLDKAVLLRDPQVAGRWGCQIPITVISPEIRKLKWGGGLEAKWCRHEHERRFTSNLCSLFFPSPSTLRTFGGHPGNGRIVTNNSFPISHTSHWALSTPLGSPSFALTFCSTSSPPPPPPPTPPHTHTTGSNPASAFPLQRAHKHVVLHS